MEGLKEVIDSYKESKKKILDWVDNNYNVYDLIEILRPHLPEEKIDFLKEFTAYDIALFYFDIIVDYLIIYLYNSKEEL